MAFECMDDCIHLKACRRIQKIGRSMRFSVPRYCTEDCGAYESINDYGDLVHISDVMNYIYDNCDMIAEGYDKYEAFASSDLEGYIVQFKAGSTEPYQPRKKKSTISPEEIAIETTPIKKGDEVKTESEILKRQDVMDCDIEILDFSVRTHNCLKRAKVNRLSDLLELTEDDLRKIRNLGSKSADEVIFKMAGIGLTLREEAE